MFNSWKSLTIVTKLSILDITVSSGYASGMEKIQKYFPMENVCKFQKEIFQIKKYLEHN